MEVGTSAGLAFSSGINAYLPLLSFAVAARWFHLYKVNPDFGFITQDWFMIILLVLTLADFLADKIPAVDHVWDAIHTIIRPIAGALAASASYGQVTGAGLTVPLLAGAALAGMTHATKAVTRVASTASTAGVFNAILSIFEDIFMALSILLSLLAPIIMTIIVVIFVLIFLSLAPRIIRMFRGRRPRRSAPKST